MDLEEIKTFLAVARLKNFTWAADELHVTQSTVTSRIKNLERFYGQHLFLRTNKKVDLSPFGKEILPLFEQQLKLIEDSKKIARRFQSERKRIRFGITYSLWDSRFTDWVDRLAGTDENLRFSFHADHSHIIVDDVLGGRIDIGLVYHGPEDAEIKKETFGEDTFFLYCARNFQIKRKLGPGDLNALPLIYLNWGRTFEHWFRQEFGEEYVPFVEVGHSQALLEFVRNGKGLAFIPERIVQLSGEKMFFKKLDYEPRHKMEQQPIHLIYRKTAVQDELIARAIQCVKEIFRKKQRQHSPPKMAVE